LACARQFGHYYKGRDGVERGIRATKIIYFQKYFYPQKAFKKIERERIIYESLCVFISPFLVGSPIFAPLQERK